MHARSRPRDQLPSAIFIIFSAGTQYAVRGYCAQTHRELSRNAGSIAGEAGPGRVGLLGRGKRGTAVASTMLCERGFTVALSIEGSRMVPNSVSYCRAKPFKVFKMSSTFLKRSYPGSGTPQSVSGSAPTP